MENKKHNDMITQENQTGKKTWGEFNLAILKVKCKSTRKNRNFTIATYTTNILLLPISRNLLTWPRASPETTDSFLWILQQVQAHPLVFL